MVIGVISDTHDNERLTEQALHFFKDRSVDLVVHCGDWVTPDSVMTYDHWAQELQLPLKGILGNNDTEMAIILENRAHFPVKIEFPEGRVLEIPADNHVIAAYHGDDKPILEALIASGK